MIFTEAQKNENQIECILHKYSKMVYRLAYARTKNRADAEDLLQEVFIRLIKTKVQFNSDEHCKAWLIRTTTNCSKNLLTSAWFRKTVPMEEHQTASEEGKSDIFYAVLNLPLKYRIVVHLYYYEDLSVAEISEVLNREEATVKTQLYRARKMLENELKGEYVYV